jgi:NADH-quinone oxidoreductase subunit H
MGAIQRRYGPNVVGIWGLLQPFADGFKLLIKEIFFPRSANRVLYLFAPSLTFILSLILWALLPFNYGNNLVDFTHSLFVIYILTSFNVYGIILAGWIGNSRYSFIGAIRAVAQMISYEVSISFIFLIIFMYTQSTNLIDIVDLQYQTCWLIFVLTPLFVIMFISILAETNRIPFDLPEAEAELVAGYNLEYSGLPFALFFLAEYSNMLFNAFLLSLLFFGGWHSLIYDLNIFPDEFVLIFKSSLIWTTFVIVRATYPRYRFDQLIQIGWTVLFPITIVLMIFYSVIPYFLIK